MKESRREGEREKRMIREISRNGKKFVRERDPEEENDTSETAQTSEVGQAGNTTESKRWIPVYHLETRKPLQILHSKQWPNDSIFKYST